MSFAARVRFPFNIVNSFKIACVSVERMMSFSLWKILFNLCNWRRFDSFVLLKRKLIWSLFEDLKRFFFCRLVLELKLCVEGRKLFVS